MMLEEGGLSTQLRNLLWELRSKRSSGHSELVVLLAETTDAELDEFYYKMYEDKNPAYKKAGYHLDYNEFWGTLQGGPYSAKR